MVLLNERLSSLLFWKTVDGHVGAYGRIDKLELELIFIIL